MRLHLGRSGAALTALLTGSTLLAGCGGGSSGIGNTSTGRVRAVDAAYLYTNTNGTNGQKGDSAGIVINGGSIDGNTQYFSSGSSSGQAASPYLYIQPQNGVPFTYSLNGGTSTGAVNSYDVTQGQYYTAYLIGREDAVAVSPTDPRYLQLILPPAQAGSTAGQATLRILDAAPDAGFTTQLTGAAISGYTTGVLNVQLTPQGGGPAATFNGVEYPTTADAYTASPYQTLTPGTYTVNVTLAAPGTGTVTTVPATIPLSSGGVYTLVVSERINTTNPTQIVYELHLISDTH